MKALLWRHKKRGTQYAAVFESQLQASGGLVVAEGATLVNYLGVEDGQAFSREKSEFEDGRFEPIGREADARSFEALCNVIVERAAECGLLITIEQRSLKPLAQGNVETVVSVRPARSGA